MTLRIASRMRRRASRACWNAARMMSSEIPLILMSIWRAVTPLADLASTGPAHHADLADRVRREVVVMHVALGVDGRERVDDLLVAARAERRDREDLRLPPREDGGTVRARQDPDLDRELADVRGAAAIRPEVLFRDGLAELVLEELLIDLTDFFERQRRVVARRELGHGLELQLVQAGLALCLVR